MKKFKKFNNQETLLVITSYPDPKQGIRELNAVAWHAQKTLKKMAKDRKVIVLAEETIGEKTYLDGKNLLVKRIWSKKNPFSLFKILALVLKNRQIRSILFQFEFNIFGGIIAVSLIPAILLVLKILAKKVVFEIHQVVPDIKKIDKHLNLKNKILTKIFNAALFLFYKTVSLFSNKIVVFEEELKQTLRQLTSEEKIEVLPLSVSSKLSISKYNAKKRLGFSKDDFVILVFGFVNWYKGSDWLAKTIAKNKPKKVKLVLAGGQNPTLKNKKYYQNFYQKIACLADKNPNIKLTGFVPDEKIKLYFSAADLVALPYRVFMSASGPLSFALSYKKPVVFSNRLSAYFKSEDFSLAASSLNLTKQDLFFPLTTKGFLSLVQKTKADKDFYAKLKKFSTTLGDYRKEKVVMRKYRQLLDNAFSPTPFFSSTFIPLKAVIRVK